MKSRSAADAWIDIDPLAIANAAAAARTDFFM
jgi:hypothetical protein